MPRADIKKAVKVISRVWMATGVLAVSYGLIALNSTPVLPIPVALGGSDQAAQTDLAPTQRLAAASTLWTQESGPGGDPFSAGFAAFELASVLHDPAWAKTAVARLTVAQEAMPQMAQIGAWRGAARSLIARDFPVQGLWQMVPGPGFVRIYYVRSAVADLNAAVEADPKDPISRLLRAASLAGMPGFLASHETSRADFALMAHWADDPGLNPAQADVLTSAKWRADFFRLYAEALEQDGHTDQAQAQRLHLASARQTSGTKELSKWNAARLIQ